MLLRCAAHVIVGGTAEEHQQEVDDLVNDPAFAWWTRWSNDDHASTRRADATDAEASAAAEDAEALEACSADQLRDAVADRQAALFRALDAASGVAAATARLQRAKVALQDAPAAGVEAGHVHAAGPVAPSFAAGGFF